MVNLPPQNGIVKEAPPVNDEVPANLSRNQVHDQGQAQAHADNLPHIQDRPRDPSKSQERCSYHPDSPNKEERAPVQCSSSVLSLSGGIKKFQLSK